MTSKRQCPCTQPLPRLHHSPPAPPPRPPTPCLQAFLLVCVGVAAATRAIHTYRSSLYTQGAVAVAISLVQGSIAFRFTAALPAGTAYDRCALLRPMSTACVLPSTQLPYSAPQSPAPACPLARWCAYLAGVCVYVAADLALAFVGDAV